MDPAGNRPKLRALIEQSCRTDPEFNAFCMDYFPDVYMQFAHGMDRLAKANLLLESADPEKLESHLKEFIQKRASLSYQIKKPLARYGFIIPLTVLLVGIMIIFRNADVKIEIHIKQPNGISDNTARQLNPDEFEKLVKTSGRSIYVEGAFGAVISGSDGKLYAVVVDKKTKQPIGMTIIPEAQVKAWVTTADIRYPRIREIYVRLLEAEGSSRAPKPSVAKNVDGPESNAVVAQPPEPSSSTKTIENPKKKRAHKSSEPDSASLSSREPHTVRLAEVETGESIPSEDILRPRDRTIRGTPVGSLGRQSVTLDVSETPEMSSVGLDKELVRRIIRRHATEANYCYSLHGNKSALREQINVRFVVGPTGAVTKSEIQSMSPQPNKNLATCLADAVKRWEFPKPHNALVEISYPFVFSKK